MGITTTVEGQVRREILAHRLEVFFPAPVPRIQFGTTARTFVNNELLQSTEGKSFVARRDELPPVIRFGNDQEISVSDLWLALDAMCDAVMDAQSSVVMDENTPHG